MKKIQFGEHIKIDGYNGEKNFLDNTETVLSVLYDLPMTILLAPSVVVAPENRHKVSGGWSGFVIIAESHIAIHTFPKRGFVSADNYTCKNDMDTQIINDYSQLLLN